MTNRSRAGAGGSSENAASPIGSAGAPASGSPEQNWLVQTGSWPCRNQLPDEDPARQLAVEDVGREKLVGGVGQAGHAEREQPPVGEQGSQRQEDARREIGPGAFAHRPTVYNYRAVGAAH